METDFSPYDKDDREEMERLAERYKQQLLRQQENQARLQAISAQLQMCMVIIARGQIQPDPKDRAQIVKIAIKSMIDMNNRTSNYAATLGACADQFTKELEDNETRLADKTS